MGFCSRQSTGSGVVVPGPRDCNVWALDCTGFCSRGTWAELPQGLWGLPGPGIKPVSPALTGGLLTTDPPGKPSCVLSDDWRLLAGVCANKRGTLPVGSREPAHLQPAPGQGTPPPCRASSPAGKTDVASPSFQSTHRTILRTDSRVLLDNVWVSSSLYACPFKDQMPALF